MPINRRLDQWRRSDVALHAPPVGSPGGSLDWPGSDWPRSSGSAGSWDHRPMGARGGTAAQAPEAGRRRRDVALPRRVSSSCQSRRTDRRPRRAMAESDWDTVTVLRKKGPTAAQAKSKQVPSQRGAAGSGGAARCAVGRWAKSGESASGWGPEGNRRGWGPCGTTGGDEVGGETGAEGS